MNSTYKKFLWLGIFSIAMGFLEAAVVIYLREIYYPGGFQFPLTPIKPSIELTEFLREMATVLMLLAIGVVAGKDKLQRFAFFIFCFAIWDIFYYVFLKLLIGWPASLFTWDILFIIPVPWVSPVLAPLIVSFTMIFLTFVITYFQEVGANVHLKRKEWIFLITGSLIIIISFISDFLKYCNTNKSALVFRGKDILLAGVNTYVPSQFNWWIFIAGETVITTGLFLFIKRNRGHGNRMT